MWADKFNRHKPPKKVEFIHVFLVQLLDRSDQPIYHVERYIEGSYLKYNSNAGFVSVGDEDDASGYLRHTPQAFSHFTEIDEVPTFRRHGRLIVPFFFLRQELG